MLASSCGTIFRQNAVGDSAFMESAEAKMVRKFGRIWRARLQDKKEKKKRRREGKEQGREKAK